MIKALFVIAAGGAIGACARYIVYLLTHQLLGHHFPYATLVVNVLGSLVMGLFIEALALTINPSESIRLFVGVGVLGAFTTFSTFALDFAVLYKRADLFLSAVYIVASVSASIVALFVGMALARRLIA